MNLKIQAPDFPLTDGLRQHISSRLAHALNNGRDVVTHIVVRLSDVNGLRGDEDKCCRIEVRLKGAPTLTVEDIQGDLDVAIDRAAERIGRALDRHLARQRDFPMMACARQQAPPEESP
ncbi:HPF/RaiA family ribosome-associated protein [Candidatus Accumulibacter phosphatis]|jgi:putative sigma-54 modulation protein|uniref:HPF/RaiA family ribosome-associated protein n=1 Tax=Candidatus Accumulibacter phosphatis TaxID=327160 RepID=A0ABX1TZY4_9PROT|nr:MULTISPECIES: HPF/RaiA family ribosome-associated protein [Candidatus Accumulibacter]NMQ29000.1 HPF/RaiA family ribosome-associated protein [Candidatus Accumulibacter phosphatis]